MTYKTVEPVDTEAFVDYLLHNVNPIIYKKQFKFNRESAVQFAQSFDGNLSELGAFLESQLTVDGKSFLFILRNTCLMLIMVSLDFIAKRKSELLHSFSALMNLFRGNRKTSSMMSLILDMIMRKGSVPIDALGDGKFEMVELLIQHNFMRWKASDPSDPLHDQRKLGSSNDLHSSNAGEVVWYSPLRSKVCEEWFNANGRI